MVVSEEAVDGLLRNTYEMVRKKIYNSKKHFKDEVEASGGILKARKRKKISRAFIENE